MRAVNAAAQALREAGGAIREASLIVIEPVNRDTGVRVPIGIWNGEDAEDILVQDIFTGSAITRQFYTGLLQPIEVNEEVGFNIRPLSVALSRLEPAVRIAFYEHDPRGARVQVFRRSYDARTGVPVAGLPEPVWAGYVHQAPDSRPADGGDSAITVDMVSTARMLTVPSARTKSDQAQRKRLGDRFRRYKSTAQDWEVNWQGDQD